MTTKEVLDAVVTGDEFRETFCMEASEHMMHDFQDRFPGQDASSVVGRC